MEVSSSLKRVYRYNNFLLQVISIRGIGDYYSGGRDYSMRGGGYYQPVGRDYYHPVGRDYYQPVGRDYSMIGRDYGYPYCNSDGDCPSWKHCFA